MKSIGAGGRPTKYKKKYCKMILEYFDKPTAESWLKKEIIKSNGTVEREYGLKAAKLPTLFGFAQSIGVFDNTLENWSKAKKSKNSNVLKYPEFLCAYNAAKQKQKEFLTTNALAGLSPPASFIFVAKNITDMRDKQEVGGDGGGPLIIKMIDYTKEE